MQCILRRGGSDALFPNDFGEDLLIFVSNVWHNGDNSTYSTMDVNSAQKPDISMH